MSTGWCTYGHDTGHSNLNDEIDGPVDLDQKWKLSLADMRPRQPVVRDGTIYVTSSGHQVNAFDIDGKGLWAYTHPSSSESSNESDDKDGDPIRGANPVVDGESVYHAYDGRCVSLDVSDGAERWSTKYRKSYRITCDGAVQIDSTGQLYLCGRTNFYAVENSSGSVVWSHSTTSMFVPPALDADRKCLIYKDKGDILCALDTRSAEQRWQYRAPEDDRIGSYRITDDQVILNEGNQLRALDLETGTRQWRATGEYQPQFLPHPPSNNLFAIKSEDRLNAIDPVTGAISWSTELGRQKRRLIRGTNQHLYLMDEDEIVRRDPESGTIEERISVGFEIGDFVVARDGIVVVGHSDETQNDYLSLLVGQNEVKSTSTDTHVFEEGDDPSYCPDCGADLSGTDDPNFCPECGTDVS